MVTDMNIPIKRRLVIFWENNTVGNYDLLEDGDELFTYDGEYLKSQHTAAISHIAFCETTTDSIGNAISAIDTPTCDAPQSVTPQAHKIILAITRIRLIPLLGTKLFPAGESDYLNILIHQNWTILGKFNGLHISREALDFSLGFFIKA